MAIFRPTEMQFSDQKFSMILYGQPGIGKTTLACSSPKPILFDLDKGVQRVKAQYRCATSRVSTYEELLKDIDETANLPEYETLVFDTGGALISLIMDYVMRKDNVNKTKAGTISIKGFGAIKQEFVRLINDLKTKYNKNVIFVFHSLEEKDKDGSPIQRLLCEGSAKNIVWQPCDFGGYMFMKGEQRVIAFTPTDEYFAKGCYNINGVREIPKLTANDKNEFITKLFEDANKNIASDNAFFEEENKQYEAVMVEGKALIEAFTEKDDINELSDKIKNLKHCLTSLAEIRQLFKDRLAELGFVWDKQSKKYVLKDVEVAQ